MDQIAGAGSSVMAGRPLPGGGTVPASFPKPGAPKAPARPVKPGRAGGRDRASTISVALSWSPIPPSSHGPRCQMCGWASRKYAVAPLVDCKIVGGKAHKKCVKLLADRCMLWGSFPGCHARGIQGHMHGLALCLRTPAQQPRSFRHAKVEGGLTRPNSTLNLTLGGTTCLMAKCSTACASRRAQEFLPAGLLGPRAALGAGPGTAPEKSRPLATPDFPYGLPEHMLEPWEAKLIRESNLLVCRTLQLMKILHDV